MTMRSAFGALLCVCLCALPLLGCGTEGEPGGGFTTETPDGGPGSWVQPSFEDGKSTGTGTATPEVTGTAPTVQILQPEAGAFYKGKMVFAARITHDSTGLQRQVEIDGVVRTGTYGDDISFELDTTNKDHWSFLYDPDPSRPLADGAHTFTVRASAVGVDPVAESVGFKVDNTGPVALWESPPEGMVAKEDVYVRLSFVDTGSGLGRYAVSLDGNDFVPLTPLGGVPGGIKELTIPLFVEPPLSAGEHVIEVQVTDTVGNRTDSRRSFFIEEYPSYVEPEVYKSPGLTSVNDALLTTLDDDTCLDLLMATDNAVFVYPGRADEQGRCIGQFGNPVTATDNGYKSVALEDRVGPGGAADGVLDLVGVASGPTGSVVRVQMGSIDPILGLRFSEPEEVEQEIQAQAVELGLGDFDGDGLKDALVTTKSQTYTIAILAGTEDGVFAPPVFFGGAVGARRAHAADLTDDGLLDVTVVVEDTPTLSIYPGKVGGMDFAVPVTTVLPAPARAIAFGDVFGDVKPDLVLSYDQSAPEELARSIEVFQAASSQVSLRYERGHHDPTEAFAPVDEVVLTNIDGDGESMLDLLALSIADRLVQTFIQWAGVLPLNFGDRSAGMYVAPPSSHTLLAADLNGDALADPVVVNADAVSVMRSRGVNVPLAVPVHHLTAPIIGLPPVDTVTDVARTKARRLGTTVDFVGHGMRHDEEGGIVHVLFTMLSGPNPTATDKHGWTRQVSAIASPALVERDPVEEPGEGGGEGEGEGEGEGDEPLEVPLGTPTQIAVGDLDMDGAEDVFLGLNWPAGAAPVMLAYIRAIGGSFSLFGSLEIEPDTPLTPPDANHPLTTTTVATTLARLATKNLLPKGERPPHVVLATNEPPALLFFNPRRGSFAQVEDAHMGLFVPAGDMKLEDINDDNAVDILALQPSLNQVALLRGQSDSKVSFEAPLLLAVGDSPSLLEVADVTKDGRPDLVVVTAGGLVLVRAEEGKLFAPPELLDASLGTLTDIEVADVNEDTRLDIIGLNEGGSKVIFLLSTPQGAFGDAITISTLARPGSVPSGALIVAETTHPQCPHVHVLSGELLALARHLHTGCF